MRELELDAVADPHTLTIFARSLLIEASQSSKSPQTTGAGLRCGLYGWLLTAGRFLLQLGRVTPLLQIGRLTFRLNGRCLLRRSGGWSGRTDIVEKFWRLRGSLYA
jgi:hypothetical protein